jgi:hypothetical protein
VAALEEVLVEAPVAALVAREEVQVEVEIPVKRIMRHRRVIMIIITKLEHNI